MIRNTPAIRTLLAATIAVVASPACTGTNKSHVASTTTSEPTSITQRPTTVSSTPKVNVTFSANEHDDYGEVFTEVKCEILKGDPKIAKPGDTAWDYAKELLADVKVDDELSDSKSPMTRLGDAVSNSDIDELTGQMANRIEKANGGGPIADKIYKIPFRSQNCHARQSAVAYDR